MGSLSQDQVNYLKNVLGIESIVFDSVVVSSADSATDVRISAIEGAPKMLVFGAALKGSLPFEGEARELLEKMIQAMKLTLKEVVLIEWTPATEVVPESVQTLMSTFEALPRLVFGNEAAVTLRAGSGDVATHSVSTLLRRPELKKETWTHLQKVMKALK
ncbi:MAG TPA: hypothetical protein VM432_08470 [Bdellovibrionales bacterium]|jgi:hypothetical protein|nr:hypothetical protein [Bdellovibrionales bacterium]